MRRFRPSLILFGIAIAVYGCAQLRYGWTEWSPVTMPIHAVGQPVSATFVGDSRAPYEVVIEYSDGEDGAYWDCVFGTESRAGACDDVQESSAVAWRVERGGTGSSGVASGYRRRAYSSRDYTGSAVTKIRDAYGVRTTVTVVVRGPAAMIGAVQPRLRINADASAHKDAAVIGALTALLAMAIAALGLLVFLVALFRRPAPDDDDGT